MVYAEAERVAFNAALRALAGRPVTLLRQIAKQDSIVGQAAQRILAANGHWPK